MVSIAPPPASWEDAILNAAIPLMNAKVCFYEATDDDYDPITGTGGQGIRVIWAGKARVQHLRAPRQFQDGVQVQVDRSFRFQLDPGDSVPHLYGGVKARVLDGGRDSSLETLAYVVDSAINSSHMAVRTIELKSNLKPVTWKWSWDPDIGVVIT